MSKKASISINTPLGRTDPFVLENLVKQGTVLGPVLNNCSLDRVPKEGSGYQMGLVNIKSLEFVDYIADVNRDFNSLCHSNRLTENIHHEKRLAFSSKKCELLRVGFKTLGESIYVNNKSVTISDCTKYLGDYVNSNGSNSDLINARVRKAQGSIIELTFICKEAQFSLNQISAMFLLYRSVFLPRLIFNCETWSNLTKQEVESLQKVQLKYLRNMMEVANSTPVAGTFLELGILPINFEIDLRKLKFLWKILQKENDDSVKQVYLELKQNCFEKNWTNEVKEVMHRYGLSTYDEKVESGG